LRSLRPIIILILACSQLSCVTEQYITITYQTADIEDAVSQCLEAVGFHNDSQSNIYKYFFDRDNDLKAVWTMPMPRSSMSRSPRSVWVKSYSNRWIIRFLPGNVEDSMDTKHLTHFFKSCVSQRVPTADVVTSSTTTFDLR